MCFDLEKWGWSSVHAAAGLGLEPWKGAKSPDLHPQGLLRAARCCRGQRTRAASQPQEQQMGEEEEAPGHHL